MDSAVAKLLVLDTVRKQAEKAMMRKAVSNILPGPLQNSCLQVFAQLEFKLLLPLMMNCDV